MCQVCKGYEYCGSVTYDHLFRAFSKLTASRPGFSLLRPEVKRLTIFSEHPNTMYIMSIEKLYR